MQNIILITAPTAFPDETTICNALFQNGLQTLHVRKPDFSETEYERFINGIDPRFRKRIVLHDFFGLVQKYALKGVHLSAKKQAGFVREARHGQVSASCHSFREIETLPFRADYCFLSPIFDSISKQGYKKAFSDDEIRSGLRRVSVPVVALGGINTDNLHKTKELGFSGAALLGAIWNETDLPKIVAQWRELSTPKVLSIAGFDPSAGAGVTSDLKTMEATGSYGLGVCSGITFQNQHEMIGVEWISAEKIIRQLNVLFEKNRPQAVKIGIIENLSVLNEVCDFIRNKIPDAFIVWDTVLRSSSGFCIQKDLSMLGSVLQKINLITPNTPEIRQLFGNDVSERSLQGVCQKHNLAILWKGGHNGGNVSEDILLTSSEINRFSVLRSGSEKHGTGCVFSAAVASFLAQGFSLAAACGKAQIYVSEWMGSAAGKLGFQPKKIAAKPSISDIKLMYITHPDPHISLAQQAEMACRGGAKLVQLRMKDAPPEELLRQAHLVKSVCERHNALFIVNDNPLIARQIDTDGVHLGKADMPPAEARALLGGDKIIGATCNTFADVQNAAAQGVDYVGVGPFRFTDTKKNLSPTLGTQGYGRIINQMKINGIHLPVFAIGGITPDDIPELLSVGVQGIALSSSIKNGGDMAEKTAEVVQIILHHG